MMVWTEERVQRLTELFNAGLSSGLIAIELQTTRNAVIGKLNRLHLHRAGAQPAFRRELQHPRHKPKPKLQLPQPQPQSQSDSPITLEDLQAHQCRWPLTDDPRNQLFCGKPKTTASSYCECHAIINKQTGSSKWQRITLLPYQKTSWR